MRIKSLRITGFRSFQDVQLTFEPGLTTLVGENNTGKSCIALALTKVLSQGTTDGNVIGSEDYPFQRPGPLAIEAVLVLSQAEVDDQMVSRLLPSRLLEEQKALLLDWMRQFGNEISLTLSRQSRHTTTAICWGGLHIMGSQLSASAVDLSTQGDTWDNVAGQMAQGNIDAGTLGERVKGQLRLSSNMGSLVCAFAMSRFKVVDEFRARSVPGQRTSNTETMTGSETASVLLNLKNNSTPREKARYRKIVKTFKQLFPHYDVDAVEAAPGNSAPVIQFTVEGYPNNPLSLSQVSAGVHQMLALTTNLVAREGLVMFLQHPEALLHPHAMRSLYSLIREASGSNQIIVVTHDPHFVDPGEPERLRRFWWTLDAGTQVRALDTPVSARVKGQLETALRQPDVREVVFARSVILVEDESLFHFLTEVAPKLGHDIDAHSVSVVFAGGKDAHRPYHQLLTELGIPHLVLRDQTWGHNPNFPPDRFLSLECELEQYLDDHGLGELRREVEAAVGDSHRRVAAALARRLDRQQVPPFFDEILKKAIAIAAKAPSQHEPGEASGAINSSAQSG